MDSKLLAGDAATANVVLGIHGGTTSLAVARSTEEAEAVRAVLTQALKAGKARLDAGHNSLDAVEAAIRIMEDSPLLNAGKGAVFTKDGRNELDASVMVGDTLQAGAVASVTIVRNPITAARAVMEKSPHVLLIGRGAEVFATQQNLELVDPAYFWTKDRWEEIQRVWEKESKSRTAPGARSSISPESADAQGTGPFGTVGAVALDARGTLAAGTSTGGLTGKAFGRIGDSPIIGAGTYADNRTVAVSCTGQGEFFIRLNVAHEISSRMRYGGQSVQDAVAGTIHEDLTTLGGRGAAIALDRHGTFVTDYNTPGLFRGWITTDGSVVVRLYSEQN